MGWGAFALAAVLGAAVEPTGDSRKVVLVSLDGAADWLVDDFLARGVLAPDGGLGRMSRAGVRAESMVTVEDSLTAVAHASMYTGAHPEGHGIVSNQFLPPGMPLGVPVSGFTAPLHAETLWSAARRQGKRVLCVSVPSADGITPDRSCDFTLGFGRVLAPAVRVELVPAGPPGAAAADPRFEHTRALEAKAESADRPGWLGYRPTEGGSLALHAFAVDRAFDGRERYDALILDTDQQMGNGHAALLRHSEWTPLPLSAGGGGAGAWVRLLELADDLSSVSLYLGAPGQNRGGPAALLDEVARRFGQWPGPPDARRGPGGSLDEGQWRDQALRLNDYLTEVVAWGLQRDDWDLAGAYLPLLDEVEHLFLLRDPRQAGYEAEDGAVRRRYADYVEWAYQAVDRSLRRWREAAPQANFIVVSDHGMVPAHTEVLVNTLLRLAGFAVTRDEKGEARAYANGGSAYVYLNLAGRQKEGVVPAAKLEASVRRIVEAAKAMRDPATGEPVLAEALTRVELARLHLAHPQNSGDVWLSARPGYQLRSVIGPEEPLFRPLRSSGMHGYLSSHREMQAIFFAGGPDVPSGPLGQVRQIDVAATAAALLGIQPPAQSVGQPVLKRYGPERGR